MLLRFLIKKMLMKVNKEEKLHIIAARSLPENPEQSTERMPKS